VPPFLIRAAAPGDAPRIAALLGQLGYPAVAAEVLARLTRVEGCGYAAALVAERDGVVIGLATGHLLPSIHATPLAAWLTTLVVDQQFTGTGVGRALTGAIEGWAESHGAVRLSVTSGLHRDGAHAFYEHVGYARTGVRLSKVFPPAP
jgi:GNAT superfamily N-acetyltransferase